MIKQILTAALLAVAVSGCSTMSSRDYAVVREEIRTDGQSRKVFTDACRSGFMRESMTSKQNLAALAGVSVARAPAVICNRIARAIANGRISHAEFNASGGDYSKWIEVVKG